MGLIAHDDDAASRRAGGVYMAFTVLGEAFLLMGFVLLAAGEPSGSLQIRRRRGRAAGIALARCGAGAHSSPASG